MIFGERDTRPFVPSRRGSSRVWPPAVLLGLLLLAVHPVHGAVVGTVVERQGGAIGPMRHAADATYFTQGGRVVRVVWDASGNPTITGISTDRPGRADDLAIDGTRAFTVHRRSEFDGRIEEFVVSGAGELEWRRSVVGSDAAGSYVQTIAARNAFLFSASSDGHLHVLDVSRDTAEPVASVELPAFDGGFQPHARGEAHWLDDTTLLIVRDGLFDEDVRRHHVTAVDVHRPEQPTILGEFTTRYFWDLNFELDGSFLIAYNSWYRGAIDWSDPSAPVLTAERTGSVTGDTGGRIGDSFVGFFGGSQLFLTVNADRSLSWRGTESSIEGLSNIVQRAATLDALDRIAIVTIAGEVTSVRLAAPLRLEAADVALLPYGTAVNGIQRTVDYTIVHDLKSVRTLSHDGALIDAWIETSNAERILAAHFDRDRIIVGRSEVGAATGALDLLQLDSAGRIARIRSLGYRPSSFLRLDEDEFLSLYNGLDSEIGRYRITDRPAPLRTIERDDFPGRPYEAIETSAGLFVSNQFGRIRRWTTSGFEAIESIGQCLSDGIDASPTHLFTACTREGFEVYRLNDEALPEAVALWRFEDPDLRARDLVVDGHRLWLTHNRGAALFDVSVPTRPLQIARYRFGLQAPTGEAPWTPDLNRSRSRAELEPDHHLQVAAGVDGLFRLAPPEDIGEAHTGIWALNDTDGEGVTLEVLANGRALATFYLYDEDGRQRWLQGTGTIDRETIRFETLYAPSGPVFADSGNSDPTVELTRVGSAQIALYSCSQGVIRLRLDGRADRTANLQQLSPTRGVGCAVERPARDARSGQSGSWADLSIAGQGFSLLWLENGSALVNWFTYSPEGEPIWIQGVGTLLGDELVFPELYTTSKEPRNGSNGPGPLQVDPWGTLRMRLLCSRGTVTWTPGVDDFPAGSMEIIRFTSPIGLDCS